MKLCLADVIALGPQNLRLCNEMGDDETYTLGNTVAVKVIATQETSRMFSLLLYTYIYFTVNIFIHNVLGSSDTPMFRFLYKNL